uniref:Uncharacterized protein n=1 Tax=Ditylenchus dipsaci TaxID=166011 RepID=A0A915DCZ5_9BILA
MAAIHHHPYYNQQHVQQPIYGSFAMNGGPAHNMVGSNNQAEMLYANSNTGTGQKINGKMVRQPQQQQYRQAHTNYRPIAQKVVQQQKRAMPVHQQMHQPQNNMRYNNQPSSGMSNMPFSPANDFFGSCAQFVINSGSATGVDKEMSNIHREWGAGKTPPSQLMYIPSPKLHQQQQQQQSRSNSASPMVLHINSNSDLLGSNQFLNIEPPPILEAEGQLSSMSNGNEPCHR